jgi:hypothetical protein
MRSSRAPEMGKRADKAAAGGWRLPAGPLSAVLPQAEALGIDGPPDVSPSGDEHAVRA